MEDFAHTYLATILIPGQPATWPLHSCGSWCTAAAQTWRWIRDVTRSLQVGMPLLLERSLGTL